MLTYICPFCGYTQDSFTPLTQCPACEHWLVPPTQRNMTYPPMEYIEKGRIENHFFCQDCGAFEQFSGVYGIQCSDRIWYEDHKRREHLIFLAEKAIKAALNYAETKDPDMNTLKKLIAFAYGWYRNHGSASYKGNENEWPPSTTG